ncbi:unnamed protein product [Caenorhabditis sp. 36 PRJEB53466]|nr:unnamed protein product [Caenorhabditis sp. 36 PRJEB53466]
MIFRTLRFLSVLAAVFRVPEVDANLRIEKEIEVALDVKDVKASPYYKDKVLSIPISKESGQELMQHWTDQAFSGLISAIATRRLKLVEKYDKKKHEKCASKAIDIKSHAKCLVELETDGLHNRWLKRKKYFDQKKRSSIEKKAARSKSSEKLKKLTSLESYEASKSSENKKKKRKRIVKSSEEAQNWVGSFRRAKREIKVKSAATYEIKTKDDMTPFSLITRQLTNTVKKLKKKEKLSKWQDVIERIRKEGALIKKRKQVENVHRKRMRVFQEAARIAPRSGESWESSASRERKEKKSRRRQMDSTIRNFASMEKYIEDEELREMFHQKTTNMTEEEKLMMIPVDIIRQAAKLGLSIAGHNTTDFEGKSIKLLSPRFMSVLPDDPDAKKKEIDIISPSLFSLHNSGTDLEQKTSLKSVLGTTMSAQDSQNFLDFLVEATGVSEAVEDAEQKLLDAQRRKDDAMGRGPDGQPLYFTKENVTERFPREARKIELMERLDKTYSVQQLNDMNTTGYTVLTGNQMHLVYGNGSPFRNPNLLRTYDNMTHAQIQRSIHATIKDVADERLKFEVRQKDIVLSPIVNTPIINDPVTASQALILSPAVMVPLIQSPAIFGSVVLSPWLFVPVILSPRILSPVILDPFMFVPIILSPLALVPVILSPGIFNPFILSPLLLSPFILSPQVMTPLILSPFALTPLILNPLALSPLVLSPFVLSPQVLSPQYVTGIILSPYALSPAIESNGAMVTVFGSPSWLKVGANLKIEKEIEVALDVKDVKASPYYKDKVLSIPISKESGQELMQHWTDQAFSGLISAIATRRLKLVEKYDKKKHEKCASKAIDIKSHAKCLVELETDGLQNRWLKRKKYFDKKKRSSIEKTAARSKSSEKLKKLTSLESYEASKSSENKKKKRKRIVKSSEDSQNWVGSFRRAKREIKVKKAESYSLKSDFDRSPFSIITKHLANTVKMLKKKEKLSKWQDVIERIRKEGALIKKRKQVENVHRKRMRVFQEAARIAPRSGESWESSASRERKEKKQRRGNIDSTMRNFASMEKYIEDEELREMFHQKSTNMTEEEKVLMIPMDIIRQAAKLGLSLGGQNISDFDRKSLKLMSPRFLSVIPEDQEAKEQEIDLLSPSLFSLHNSGTDLEQKTSLKSVLGTTMSAQDSQNFLDFLVEATGVSEAVEDAEQKLLDAQRRKDDAMGRGPDGQPLYFTKENVTERFPREARKIELMERLDKTYSVQQLNDMNTTGYTVLTGNQMHLVYGNGSPFRNPNLLRTYDNMTHAQIQRSIHATIKDVADERLKFEVRQKDVVLSPVVATAVVNNPVLASQPFILSPILMVPLIQSPAIFGVIVLSPWLFVPVILSPRVLSPVILTPFVFAPIILSPLALVPVILSPGVFNPFILSPLVLCPFILSPQVMTPLILSPFALTPLILNPLALSPLVLSPFVLSPQVLSPQYVSGIILSPYALSPAIESNGAMVTVFASPSWLS